MPNRRGFLGCLLAALGAPFLKPMLAAAPIPPVVVRDGCVPSETVCYSVEFLNAEYDRRYAENLAEAKRRFPDVWASKTHQQFLTGRLSDTAGFDWYTDPDPTLVKKLSEATRTMLFHVDRPING